MGPLEANPPETLAARGPGVLAALERSTGIRELHQTFDRKVVLRKEQQSQTLVGSTPEAANFDESVFNSLVSLKVAVSQYAMHLSGKQRKKIFDALDYVINVDDWHEGDKFPKLNAFRDFLRWTIYSQYNKWISFGVSDAGDFLVAWKTDGVLLTANFSGEKEVRWTVERTNARGEKGFIAGRAPLQMFADDALKFLDGAARDASN